jgi:hypothetical protein
MARRLRSGDVLEVEFPKVPSPEVAWPDGGYGYLTYVGKHRNGVDAVRVRPGILYERPSITEDLFKDSYIALYLANAAVKLKLATVVGQLAPVPMPRVFRRSGGINREGKVLNWFIDDENGTTATDSLTDAERQIPIAAVWNHELVLIRMSEGWRPEKAVTNLGRQT